LKANDRISREHSGSMHTNNWFVGTIPTLSQISNLKIPINSFKKENWIPFLNVRKIVKKINKN